MVSKQTGTCDFCLTAETNLVDPSVLVDYFQSVCSIYVESDLVNALNLEQWFQQDWQIFSSLDSIKARALLAEILDDGEIVRKKHLPRVLPPQTAVEKWASFRNEIQCKNRFFINHELDLDRLKWLFQYLYADATLFSGVLYRARIQADDLAIPLSEMGKPPASLAKNGRANPLGIPYLYAASTPETAIAETRPHPGDLISVAQFTVPDPLSLKLLNLQHPRKTISPFAVEEGQLPEVRHELEFLCHLGGELSKPVLPRAADLEYLPTQYLSEFIKNCGYDGVVFISSISTGSNIALFDDSKIHAASLTQYKVTNIHYIQEMKHA